MYAAIRRYRLDLERSDEVIRRIVEDFVPLVREGQGVLAYYVLDVRDGTFATITICEREAEVEESSKKATEWIKQYLASAILSQEEVPSFFIKVEETLRGALYGEASESLLSQNLHQDLDQDLQEGAREPLRQEVSESSTGQRLGLLLSLSQVCEELGMSKSWVYRKVRSGEIPSIKLGHNIKVKREHLDAYLKDQHYRPTN